MPDRSANLMPRPLPRSGAAAAPAAPGVRAAWANWLDDAVLSRERWPAAVLVIGLLASTAIGLLLRQQQQAQAEAQLARQADRLVEQVQRRFDQPLVLLRGMTALWSEGQAVPRALFQAQAARLQLSHDQDGVLGLGFAQLVPERAVAALEAAERRDGAPYYALHPRSATTPGLEPLRVPVTRVEPAQDNALLLGLDLASEARLKPAIDLAVSSGVPVLAALPAMPVPDGHAMSHLLLLPVYRLGPPPATAELRRRAIQGLMLARLDARALLAGLYGEGPDDLNFRLLEPEQVAAVAAATTGAQRPGAVRQGLSGWVEFDSLAGDPLALPLARIGSPTLRAERNLRLHDRSLRLVAEPSAAQARALLGPMPTVVTAGGAVTSLLLALMLHQYQGQRRRAAEMAARMTSDLERLALVAKRTSNAVVITDAQRRITWVNEAFERITGYSALEAVGRSPGKLLQFAGTDPITVARIRSALDAGRPFQGLLQNLGKSGRSYWLDLEIQPLRDANGRVAGFMALETDVTERLAAEQALRASQAFLDKAGRIGGVGGWAVDLVTRQVQWSDQTCRILDLEPGHQPTLEECLHYCTAETRPQIEAAIARGLEAGTSWDAELTFITARGRPIWVRLSAELEFADAGPLRVVGALQDITARRQMEAESRRNAELLRGAIDVIDEAFVVYDPEDRLVFCNDKYRAVYGKSGDLMVPGAHFEDIVREGARRGQYPAALGREEAWVAERMAAHRAGNTALVQRIDDGRVLRIVERKTTDGHHVGFRIDITDLVRATETAERALQTKSEFIATISHELRTPLQSILGFSTLGETFAAEQPQFQQLFQEIQGGGQRMLTLVNGLLDMSRLDSGHTTLDWRLHDLLGLCTQVAQELRPQAAERQLQLRLPAPGRALEVQVDGFLLQQVLRNVLANALRFAPTGSVIEVQDRILADGPDAGQVELTVRDHGPGVPEDELEAIFEPFVQSSRTKDGSGGTGLGLAICRRIMRAHHGSIHAENAEGGGTRLHIRLPRAGQAGAPSLPAARLTPAPTPPATPLPGRAAAALPQAGDTPATARADAPGLLADSTAG